MRPKGTAEELERRRRRAVALLDQGYGVREVAEMVGASPGAVTRWRQAHEEGGDAGLAARKNVTPPPAVHDTILLNPPWSLHKMRLRPKAFGGETPKGIG